MKICQDTIIKLPVLETERLILRHYKNADLPTYYEMMADPDITRYLFSGKPMSEHDAWRSMATMAGHWMLNGYGQWALEEKSSGQFVGRAGLIKPEGWPAIEAGWVLHKRAWGKGYATEAGRAVIGYGFETLNQERIISMIQPDNTPSIKVAERLGESFNKKITLFGIDALEYAIDRETYQRLYKQ
ncbi:GNAT family N-acetyltransferase [Kangiella sp. M94]